MLYLGELRAPHGVVGIIMAGGQGTRFWPASRRHRPKQFLNLAGGARSLIQATAERLAPLVGNEGILVVTAEEQRELVSQHLPDIAMLLEPTPRNTAPCIGYAAAKVLQSVGDVPMVCVPADHLIVHPEQLIDVFHRAVELVRKEEVLVTIGIPPLSPDTGYGYIRARGRRGEIQEVQEFVEKPDLETAKQYVASGEYFWNSGMFVWRPTTILAAITRYLPDLAEALAKISHSFLGAEDRAEISRTFAAIRPISIDFGVMEKADNVRMLSGDGFTWSDVGSWASWAECLANAGGSDKDNNLAHGSVVSVDSKNCVVVSESRLVATVGLDNVIVVETPDAVLVCHRDRTQDVRQVVELLKEKGRSDLL